MECPNASSRVIDHGISMSRKSDPPAGVVTKAVILMIDTSRSWVNDAEALGNQGGLILAFYVDRVLERQPDTVVLDVFGGE